MQKGVNSRAAQEASEPPLSEEAAVTITVNDREVATLLCTPRDLREMAIGWLYGEGMIDSPADIVSLAGCAHDRELLVSLNRELPHGAGNWRLITSGCGAAGQDNVRLDAVPRVTSETSFSLAGLRARMREMRDRAVQYQHTGGVHSAALVTDDRLLAHREDIGRHNAIDKVVGHALLSGIDCREAALLATGRLSSEMVWKAARAGSPLVASLSIPSDLARDIAEAAGITLVGRILSARPWVYTHPERLRDLQQ
jgi:FdhD protein